MMQRSHTSNEPFTLIHLFKDLNFVFGPAFSFL